MAITLSSVQYTIAQMAGTPYIVPQAAVLATAIASSQNLCISTGTTATPQQLTSTTTGGSGTYTYQWQSSSDSSTWTNISGATAANYTPSALAAGIYYYRLQVTGGAQTAISNGVKIMATRSLSAPTITLTGPCTANPTYIYRGAKTLMMTASVPAIAGATYSWTLPSGLTAQGSTTGNTITFTADSVTSSSYSTNLTISVVETGGCNSVSNSATVTAILLPNNTANAQVVAKALFTATHPTYTHGIWLKWQDINGAVYYNVYATTSQTNVDGVTCGTSPQGNRNVPSLSYQGTSVLFNYVTYWAQYEDAKDSSDPDNGCIETATSTSGNPTYAYLITGTTQCGLLFPSSGGVLGVGTW